MAEASRVNTSSTSTMMLKRFILNDNQPKKRRKLSSTPNDITNVLSRFCVPLSTWNFRLVWLVSDTNNFGKTLQTSTALFQNVINTVNSFTDLKQCVDLITNLKDETIFLIVTEEIGQQAVRSFQNLPQVSSIYILHSGKTTEDQWCKLDKRVKGVYANVETICEALRQDVRLSNRNLMPINVVSQAPTTNLNEIDPSFMYSQLLKEIFIDMPHDEKEKMALVEFCYRKYADNETQRKIIAEFERQYDKPSPIWWYTRECFLYWMLNSALRTHDTETILQMGFFLRDLHCQIQQSKQEQRRSVII